MVGEELLIGNFMLGFFTYNNKQLFLDLKYHIQQMIIMLEKVINAVKCLESKCHEKQVKNWDRWDETRRPGDRGDGSNLL